MIRITTCLLLCLIGIGLPGADYAVSSISPELKKGAGAVIREASEQFEILNQEESRYTEKSAITIYNSDFLSLATFVANYDKLSKNQRHKDYLL